MTNEVLRLPNYPSTQSRKGLSASELASLYRSVASTLGTVIALPAEKRDNVSTRNFLSSFSKDTALQTLQNLIWNGLEPITNTQGTDEKVIHKKCLLLAEKLAASSPGLDVQSLLDVSIIYARSQPSRVHLVFEAAFRSNPSLTDVISDDLVPGLGTLLSQQTPSSQGLYAQRKVAECIFSFLRAAKGIPELIRPFAHNKQFMVALASTYDVGMATIATSYGGIAALIAGMSAQNREPDEWERIWVETKVTLLDSFHILLSTLLGDLASSPPGPRLAAESERTFDVIFAILEAPSSSSSNTLSTIQNTPFLNQSLLADYQHSYSFSKTLATALKHAHEKDVRLDLLESTLESLDVAPKSDDKKIKNAGALKILLRSSGIQPGIDNLGNRQQIQSQKIRTNSYPNNNNDILNKGKGKSRAIAPSADPDLDIKATQVLDILPDTPVEYVKSLLAHDRYGRNPEKVVEAILEGTAMTQEELEAEWQSMGRTDDVTSSESHAKKGEGYSVYERKNLFDDEVIDVSKIRFGKKSAGDEVLRDRSFIEQMKADILRRAEAITDEEDEGDDAGEDTLGESLKGKGKANQLSKISVDLGPDDDEDNIIPLHVAGDGEGSDDEDDEDDGDGKDNATPETILELAYLRDPKAFERDASTRRSKARAELKAQTGWSDEQIEGWKIMLDREPSRKARLTEKHEFRGNEKGLDVHAGRSSGRGRGRGGGGRGRGGSTAVGKDPSDRGDNTTRERVWKDKHKASRGNHNRKRGHDKKMARAGPGPSA